MDGSYIVFSCYHGEELSHRIWPWAKQVAPKPINLDCGQILRYVLILRLANTSMPFSKADSVYDMLHPLIDALKWVRLNGPTRSAANNHSVGWVEVHLFDSNPESSKHRLHVTGSEVI